MAVLSALLLLAALAFSFEAARRLACCALAAGPALLLQARSRAQGLVRFLRGRLMRCNVVARLLERRRERRRAAQLRQAMPEMLRLLCIALDAGSSLVKALEYAADNCDEPLASELSRAVWDVKSGQGFDEAMRKLRSRTGGSEFSYLAVAMEVQHRSGGSLSTVLDAVSSSLQKSAELEEELRTQTAQGRLSARVVALMPFAILGVLMLFSPGYLGSFFASPLGVLMLAFALVLELAGILLVRRVLAIDLSAGTLGEGS